MINTLINLKALILSYKSKSSKKLGKILIREALTLSTAESCTGGLISSRLTDIAGSSAYTRVNLVTYSNEMKNMFLKVSENTLKTYGAVSEQCAREMAEGLSNLTHSDIVLCTTGVAGPDTSEGKPVGLMYCACGYNGKIEVREFRLNSAYNRKNMKFMFSEKAIDFALETILTSI